MKESARIQAEYDMLGPEFSDDGIVRTVLRQRIAQEQAREAQRFTHEHPEEAVRFHDAFGQALGGSWTNDDRRVLRRALIREEFREYRDAEDADDAEATLDALFAAVHAANMARC